MMINMIHSLGIFYLFKRLSIHSISNRCSPGMISDKLVRYPNMISCSLISMLVSGKVGAHTRDTETDRRLR